MKHIALSLALSLSVAGCAAALPIIATVLRYVDDAALILQTIDDHADLFFTQHPNEELQRRYTDVMTRARSALHLALRAERGANQLSDDEIDAAFAEFRDAYKELLRVTAPMGVRQATDPGDGRMAAPAPGILVVPQPLALGR